MIVWRGLGEKINSYNKKECSSIHKAVLSLNDKIAKICSAHKKITACLLVVVFAGYFWMKTPVRSCLAAQNKGMVQQRAADVILNSGIKEPKIIYQDCLDLGLFYLTDTYPVDGKFCSYNLYSVDDLGYSEKYIQNGYADFIASIGYINPEGYTLVMEGENTDSFETFTITLYARNDLI